MFVMRLSCTRNLTFIFRAMTFLIDLLFAGWTFAFVAFLLADMEFTVQQFLTSRITLNGLFDATLHSL